MTAEGMDLQLVRKIVDLNKEGDRLWGGLKHNNLSIYIDKVVGLFVDMKLPAAVIIIDNIHQSRAEAIQTLLKEKQFSIPTQVRINFLDGSDLVAQFGKKKEVV
ncbi:hypothetical protein PCC6912_39510 [Chlorogloeopsis fritschii PCC 6912]|uniref:Uncharacterized protein n=1 Tax=Chlorogloeopsis fritschii PCC 6912 TaxID=211165 RepID=A0A3S1FF83_CHLFR|nr:hypothetical protein [Chlorogloeopsis fritschii]RUR76992.1 hypothetical protein PCC6912_39510 [Chlorogloeopsis fritschii PCC 6912]